MARPTIAIDITCAQNILNKLTKDQFNNELSLCKFVSDEYNKNFSPQNHINHQIIKLRIQKGVITLPFDMPRGKRGRQPGVSLSAEHKEKLQEGRKNKEKKIVANQSKEWSDNMKESFSNKSTLLNGILSGKAKACVKGFCIQCVGGYNNRSPEDPSIALAVRDCHGVSCPLYTIRPFQKKNNAEENNNVES